MPKNPSAKASSRLLIHAASSACTIHLVSRVFLSHSSRDSIEALALKTRLEQAEPGLVGEVVVDLDPDNDIPAGVRWKEALRRANDRCKAVICLRSKWDASHECHAEYRTAEDRGKPSFPVRLEPTAGRDITSERQRNRLRCAAHPVLPVETGLRIWPRLRPTDRPRAGVTSHSTRIHPLSVGTRVLGRWHAATVYFLCP
jgi:TIR domain